MDLNRERFAELVALAISGAFVSGMRAASAAGGAEIVESYGGPDAIGYTIDLRNPLAARRAVTPDGLRAVYRYDDHQTVTSTVERSLASGLLMRDASGAVQATERGLHFLGELFAVHARALRERWNPRFVDRLNPLIARVLNAAGRTGGAAWAVQAPPHEPSGTAPAVALLNRLSTLRYHRADAHAAAWEAAGWSLAEASSMPWGIEWSTARQAIETDTNVRAAAPYSALSPDERLVLLADLAALS